MAIGYKLLRIKKAHGVVKLYPLYVLANKETPVGVWLDAEDGPVSEKGKVKSRLGDLAYRPGWHINDKIPYVEHIYSLHDGQKYMRDDCVWCEVEYHDGINYQPEANACGINKKGKLIKQYAFLSYIPQNGYYKYKTSPSMYGEWIIAGEMKINRVMSDQEVKKLCNEAGLVPLERYRKST